MTQVVLTFEPIQPCSKVLTVEGLTTMDMSISIVLGYSAEQKSLTGFTVVLTDFMLVLKGEYFC